jgi:hypothetical protein
MHVQHRAIIEMDELVLASSLDSLDLPSGRARRLAPGKLASLRWVVRHEGDDRAANRTATQPAGGLLDFRKFGHRSSRFH